MLGFFFVFPGGRGATAVARVIEGIGLPTRAFVTILRGYYCIRILVLLNVPPLLARIGLFAHLAVVLGLVWPFLAEFAEFVGVIVRPVV